ncbi:hypothetical protein L9F63_013329, partial [Diploptera punctata]
SLCNFILTTVKRVSVKTAAFIRTPSKLSKKLLTLCRLKLVLRLKLVGSGTLSDKFQIHVLKISFRMGCSCSLNSFSYACTLEVTISELVNVYIADVRKYPATHTIVVRASEILEISVYLLKYKSSPHSCFEGREFRRNEAFEV